MIDDVWLLSVDSYYTDGTIVVAVIQVSGDGVVIVVFAKFHIKAWFVRWRYYIRR